MDTDPIKYGKNRGYEFDEEQQRALDEGRITEAEWFHSAERFSATHYLAAENPPAQSGRGGAEAAYRYAQGMLLEAIDRSGTCIDVGGANGHLIEMIHRWLQGSGLQTEFTPSSAGDCSGSTKRETLLH